MARVMVKCPKTGGHVFTGIETDATTFERLPDAIARTQCPHCGDERAWRKADATLVDTSPERKTKE